MGQDDVWVELTRRGSTRGAGNRVWSGRTGVRAWSVVETYGQWVGLRLRRTSASGKLVKVHFSRLVWRRPAPVCCPATHSSRDPATGDFISTSERE